MRLFIKNNLFSLKGSSTITNEVGDVVYKVDGRVFSLSRKKYIYDRNGKFLYVVKNKIFKFLQYKAFILDANNNIISTVVRRISFTSKFDVYGKMPIYINGDIFGFNYEIVAGNSVIARVSRSLVTLTDQFCLDVDNPSDAPYLVALVIAIDNICDDMQNSSD